MNSILPHNISYISGLTGDRSQSIKQTHFHVSKHFSITSSSSLIISAKNLHLCCAASGSRLSAQPDRYSRLSTKILGSSVPPDSYDILQSRDLPITLSNTRDDFTVDLLICQIRGTDLWFKEQKYVYRVDTGLAWLIDLPPEHENLLLVKVIFHQQVAGLQLGQHIQCR